MRRARSVAHDKLLVLSLPNAEIPRASARGVRHFEIDPDSADAQKKWDDMVGLVDIADQYHTPLTIMFWPGSAEYALSSAERLAEVRDWQMRGHEVGTHDQGCSGIDTCSAGSFECFKPEDAAKYAELAGDYGILSGTSSACEGQLASFKYYAGGRFDGRLSYALKYVQENGLTVYRTHIKAGYAGGTPLRIQQYVTLRPGEIYGAVNHGEGANFGGYEDLIEWLEFLSEKDPVGERRMTLRDLMESYAIPNNLYVTWEQVQNQATPEIATCSAFLGVGEEIPSWYPETPLFNFGRCLKTGTYCEYNESWCDYGVAGHGNPYSPRGCEEKDVSEFEPFEYCPELCGNGYCA